MSESLFKDLALLEKASHYRTLSMAAQALQISQPHLSRIIQKIEKELNTTLLDRESKKTTVWREEAKVFFVAFQRQQNSFLELLHSLQKKDFYRDLKFVCLEGLAEHTLMAINKFRKSYPAQSFVLDVLDLGELELAFNTGSYDVALTSREPKFARNYYLKNLGYQNFELFHASSNQDVVTHFESNEKKHQKAFWITNSMAIKKLCIEELNCRGKMPTSIRKNKNMKLMTQEKNASPVLLLGHSSLDSSIWQKLNSVF